MIDVNEFVNLTEPQEDRSLFKLGIVHSLFNNNTAKILFDGEDEPSEKEYAYLASYTPVVGDRVILASTSGTYIILGKINYNEKPDNKISSNMSNDKNGNMNIDYMYVDPSTHILHVRRKNGAWTRYAPSS